jgi:hypothetical protein
MRVVSFRVETAYEAATGRVQGRGGSAGADPHRFGDLGLGQPTEVAQHDGDPLPVGQSCHLAPELDRRL